MADVSEFWVVTRDRSGSREPLKDANGDDRLTSFSTLCFSHDQLTEAMFRAAGLDCEDLKERIPPEIANDPVELCAWIKELAGVAEDEFSFDHHECPGDEKDRIFKAIERLTRSS